MKPFSTANSITIKFFCNSNSFSCVTQPFPTTEKTSNQANINLVQQQLVTTCFQFTLPTLITGFNKIQ